jgi:hypothetical protein
LSTLLVASATEFMFMIMKKIGVKNRAGDPELLAIGVCDATARSKAISGFFFVLILGVAANVHAQSAVADKIGARLQSAAQKLRMVRP